LDEYDRAKQFILGAVLYAVASGFADKDNDID